MVTPAMEVMMLTARKPSLQTLLAMLDATFSLSKMPWSEPHFYMRHNFSTEHLCPGRHGQWTLDKQCHWMHSYNPVDTARLKTVHWICNQTTRCQRQKDVLLMSQIQTLNILHDLECECSWFLSKLNDKHFSYNLNIKMLGSNMLFIAKLLLKSPSGK